MALGAILAEQMDWTRDWTRKLVADLAGSDWGYQPGPGVQHPLWLCGHLAVSQNVLIHVRCLGQPLIDDAFATHFPIGAPVRSLSEHAYPEPEAVLAVMEDVHRQTLAAVRAMSDETLAEPASGKDGQPHPHYRDKRGAVTHCFRHEAFHAGQLALLRRMTGKPFLR